MHPVKLWIRFPSLTLSLSFSLDRYFIPKVNLTIFNKKALDLLWDKNLAMILSCLLKPKAQQKPTVSDVKLLHTQHGICTTP